MVTATRLIVHGRVQGVFYRDWTVTTARELGLAGWVRNRPDGTVEAHCEGTREAVEALSARMHDGPPRARVERVESTEVPVEGLEQFRRR